MFVKLVRLSRGNAELFDIRISVQYTLRIGWLTWQFSVYRTDQMTGYLFDLLMASWLADLRNCQNWAVIPRFSQPDKVTDSYWPTTLLSPQIYTWWILTFLLVIRKFSLCTTFRESIVRIFLEEHFQFSFLRKWKWFMVLMQSIYCAHRTPLV